MKSPSVNYKDNLILHGKVFHADDRCGDYLFFQPIPKIGMSNFYKSLNAISQSSKVNIGDSVFGNNIHNEILERSDNRTLGQPWYYVRVRFAVVVNICGAQAHKASAALCAN